MVKFRDFITWLMIDASKPAIALAQYRELQRQIPLLYALLMVNAAAVAYSHFHFAPDYLTIGVLAPLIAISATRMVSWIRRRNENVAAEVAIRQLRRTLLLSVFLAVTYIAWSLSLDHYGGPMQRGHVALFIAITVIGCIFCLMHLPQAALSVMVLVTIPYMIHYISLGEDVYIAIAMNIFLVCMVMVQVLLNGYTGFTKLIVSQDELAKKQAETALLNKENERLAHTDSLTELPNRRYFFAELEREIGRSQGAKGKFAVGVLDLDRFKLVNDTFGHQFGDQLLAQVGARLRDMACDRMQVCRLGSDEFGLLIQTAGDGLETLGQTICDRLSIPYMLGETRVTIGCSCGLAVYPDTGRTGHELFDRSDYALYNSKMSRRGKATVYSSEHEARIRSDRAIESALQSASLEDEFEVYFQPIITLADSSIAGFEALARWRNPLLGVIAPDTFIAVAERTGHIHRLTICLFRKAVAQILSLPGTPSLSFNLSAHDITSPETVATLLHLVDESGVAPQRITFEITETAVMDSYDAAADALGKLRQAGVKIALDDFGTGYSSLGYLHRLPIDGVKVDRSFVSGLSDTAGHNVVTSVIALCHTMGLTCVVEGIEEAWQEAALRKLNCRFVQGYRFARPKPIGDIRQSLKDTGRVDGLVLPQKKTVAQAAAG